MTPEPRLITAAELAAVLGLPRRSVWDLARRGGLPGTYRVGHLFRFDLAEVLAGLREPVGARGGAR